MKDVIVIGNDHYNPLCVIRSLGVAGFTPTLIVIQSHKNQSYISKSKYVKKCYFVARESKIADLLLGLDFTERVAVIACSDRVATVLDAQYDALTPKYFIPNCGGIQGRLLEWMNKNNQQEAAKQAGLRVIESHVLKTTNVDEETISLIQYPCIIKPVDSSKATKDNFRICENEQSLRKSLDDISAECPEVIVQKYLNREYEFNILGCRVRNEEMCCHPGGYYRTKACTNLNNMGMPCYGYVKEQIHSSIDMVAWRRFIDKVDYEGLFSTEFLIADGLAYFLEINLRNDGDLFLWTKAGANLPATLVRFLYGMENGNEGSCKFTKEKVFGMNEINYAKYCVKPHAIFENIKEWLRCSCYTIFDWHDLKPVLYKIIYSFHR